MTQEEKAKAYDEALERARAIINDYEERGLEEILFYAKEDLGYIFPELAESEDERTRKEILNVFKQLGKDTTLCGRNYDYAKWIAWLEKQGEPKEYTFKSIPRLLDRIEPSDRATVYCQKLIDTLVKEGYNTDAKIVGECLKKMNGEDVPMAVMDEQKPINDTDEDIVEAVKDTSILDKVEPKFKVGDWITDGEAIFHVTSYDINYGYQLETQKGTLFHFSDEKVENKYHLWTIKDAKDGDVLQLGTVTAIFKKYIGQEKCICYCSIDENGVFEIPIEEGEDNIYGCTNTTPATKEQRALLFQKMNEEGYEWNAELKKVSKITTPADVGFEELGKAWAEEANKQNLANSAKTCKKSQRMISAEAKEALYDKFAWSEEDDEMLDGIILRCEKYGHQEQINWLKSLKERIGG